MTDQKHDHLKWYTIGFLSALGAVALAVVVLIYFMTPLVKVDESTGRLQFLGGFIDVQARDVITQLSKEGSFVIGNIEGVEKIAPEIETIAIKFGSGEVRLDYNSTDEMNWDCDGAGKSTKVNTNLDEKTVTLDFSAAFVDCDVSVPVRAVKLQGISGEIEIRKIQANLDVKLTSGDVFLQPLADKNYIYDLKAASGEVDESFRASAKETDSAHSSPNNIQIKGEVKIGNIQPLD